MPSARRSSSWFRTLRFRLMIWNALVVIITACVTLIALREGVRITLERELDQLLAEDAREIEIALRNGEAYDSLFEQLDRKERGHAQHQWFAQLIRYDGKIVYQTAHAPRDKSSDAAAPDTTNWRIVSKRFAPDKLVIHIGASKRLIREDIARLDRFVVLCAGGVLIVAPLGGYWLAGRATRPLAEIISTTARLRPSHLDERLTIRGTGDELDRLSQTLNRLLDRIGRYLQEHRDFLANSAHELRTPLAAIRSSIEVALSNPRTAVEYEELLSDIIEESSSLEHLVNQLLLLSETETERLKVEKERVRLEDLVERAMDMFGSVAEYHDITLTCPALPAAPVQGNRQHLRQLIYNLLDNALKFTPSGGTVDVRLRIDSDRDEVVFSVQDSGEGIPADEIPHLFDRFFRGKGRRQGSSQKRGTGLGLSICQAIVRAHDGTLRVNSELGKGTIFTVRFPIDGDGTEPPTPGAAKSRSAASSESTFQREVRPHRFCDAPHLRSHLLTMILRRLS